VNEIDMTSKRGAAAPINQRATRRPRPTGARVHERGSVALWFLLMLMTLLAFGAFAIDVPRVFVVTGELQNAADAAALAGAAALSTGTNGPNWAGAATAATAAIPLNASDGTKLSSGAVKPGYWDFAASVPAVQAPSTVSLPAPSTKVPAVRVTIRRDVSANGGLVALLLGALLGRNSTADSATAVAIVAPPSTVPPGALFPVVLDQCVYNQFWDSKINQPKIDPSTNQPYELQIGNGQQYSSSCFAGQWTSFLTSFDNVPTVRDLITSGNPSPVSIGDNIWLQPGVKDTIYSSVPTGVTVIVPIANQIDTNTFVPVVAFAAFHIDGSNGGSDKFIQGHFVGGFTMPTQGSGIGPNYGGYVAPRIAL
jgi:Flp pilus assembly protein TadG